MTDLLREALAARWVGAPESEARLADALHTAAAEARARGLRPEELVVALKSLAAQLAPSAGLARTKDADERGRFLTWLVSASLKAYFGE